MHEGLSNASLAQQLSASSTQLGRLASRVGAEYVSAARIAFSGWSGPASWGAHLLLVLLEREIETATDLIRAAANLTWAAAEEVRARG